MSTRFQDEQAAQSFAALKKTARSDDDILDWLKEYAYCLPEVPEVLVPYLEVDFDAADSYTAFGANDIVYRSIPIMYTAKLPQSRMSGVSSQDFQDLFGVCLDATKMGQPSISIDKRFQLKLPLVEWSYASVLAALEVIDEQKPPTMDFYKRVKSCYDSHFPGMPWTVLVSSYNAGLLPEAPEDIIDSLRNTAKPNTSNVALPEELNP